MPAASPSGTTGPRILAVTEATKVVAALVRADEQLRDLWVEGEVGRVTVSTAGHAYFAIKDDKSQLQCVWFRDDRLRSAFQPQTGLRVVVHGRMDLYEPQGALQFYVVSLSPRAWVTSRSSSRSGRRVSRPRACLTQRGSDPSRSGLR